jgi:hypothetical protein
VRRDNSTRSEIPSSDNGPLPLPLCCVARSLWLAPTGVLIPNNWGWQSRGNFAASPFVALGQRSRAIWHLPGGIGLTVSGLERTMQRFELAMRGHRAHV